MLQLVKQSNQPLGVEVFGSNLPSCKMAITCWFWTGNGLMLAACWAPSQNKDSLSKYGIPMLKMRRSRDRLIFNRVIFLLVRWQLYIEVPPWFWSVNGPMLAACPRVWFLTYTLWYSTSQVELCPQIYLSNAHEATKKNMGKSVPWVTRDWLYIPQQTQHNQTLCIFMGYDVFTGTLTHWLRDKMAHLSQMLFSNLRRYFQMHFHERFSILIRISPKFVPKGTIDNKLALVWVMPWDWTGNKPLPEPMLTQFTDAYIAMRVQWVNRGRLYLPWCLYAIYLFSVYRYIIPLAPGKICHFNDNISPWYLWTILGIFPLICSWMVLNIGSGRCLGPLLLTWFNFNPSMDK